MVFFPKGEARPTPSKVPDICYGHNVNIIYPKKEDEWGYYDVDPTEPCQLCEKQPLEDCQYEMHCVAYPEEFDEDFHKKENCCSKCHKNGMIDPEDYSFHQWECVKRTHDLQDYVETGNVFPV